MGSAMTTRDDRHATLEGAIDEVVASYDSPAEINNLESAALPNKRAVCDAFAHIKPVLYMGFYSKHSLTPKSLRHRVSEHLYPADEILVEQIERAVSYEVQVGRAEPKPKGWAQQVVLDFFRKIPEIRRLLNLDVLAAYQGDPAASSVEEVVFSYPSIEAITAHRIAHEFYHAGVPMIPRIIAEDAHSNSGIDINPGATIGESFFIDHGTGVVVGETTVIGDRVKLYQGVTLGALSVSRSEGAGASPVKRHPTIEDDVTVYAGASIHGGETVIGKGSVIGGNVWLMRSVPPGSKVFGRPKE